MRRLMTRLEQLEGRRGSDVCPEHLADPAAPRSRDYRDGLAAFSPDLAERARYHAEQDALEAVPPCVRCGWTPAEPFRVVCREDWGQHGAP